MASVANNGGATRSKKLGGVTGKGFKPGQSGNPSGRPKVEGHVRELARQHTELAIRTLAEIAGNPGEPSRARVAAAEALLDRAWGRPAQAITGPDGEGLEIVVRIPRPGDDGADGGH